MDVELRPVSREEAPAFFAVNFAAFGEAPTDEEIEHELARFEPERSLAAFDDDQLVATAGAFSLELTLPGGPVVPVAGVSYVGVLPTHRRRGVLTSLMRRQLDDVGARGEAIAILTASEGAIYGRFGYGVATTQLGVDVPRGSGGFVGALEDRGRVVFADADTAAKVLPDLHDRARRARPGDIGRRPVWWEWFFRDPKDRRHGASARFYAVHESPDGEPDGYAAYRVRDRWDGLQPGSELQVGEVVATSADAHAALWRYLLDVDLMAVVKAWKVPVDEPLRWLLADPRAMQVTRWTDDVWARVIDVGAALRARRYATEGRLVLEVHDTFCPQNEGRWVLDAGLSSASCKRGPRSGRGSRVDLELGVAELGSLLLGGVRASTLARARRIEERTAGGLARADALFTTEPAPFCRTGF